MNKIFFTAFLIFSNLTLIFAQKVKEQYDTSFKANYPEGIYKTKEDFISKIPSEIIDVTPKGLIGLTKPVLTAIEHSCFFYNTETDEKIKRVFAISYKGHLYFQINAILKNRNKSDRSQTSDFPNAFVRVMFGGSNYLYTEVALANVWAQGFAYGGIGGAVGSALASTMFYGKGVVWDYKNSEFNIFRNCEDYNEFLKDKYKEGVQKCEDNQPDGLKVRITIDKIK